MKKFLFILCLMPVLVGCSTENQDIIESQPDSVAETTAEVTTKMTTESATAKATEPEKIEPTYTEISENIKLYDLNKHENSELIPAEEEYFNTVGYSEFDLDSYEIRDIPLQINLESLKCRRTNDVTADGRLSAVIRDEDDSYIITVISLESGEVTDEYILETTDKYGNMELEFESADKLHLYAKRHEDNTYHLYVFDIA